MRLSTSLQSLVRPGAVARISLAWLDHGAPLFDKDTASASTGVVRWPTDEVGNLRPEDLEAAVVMPWSLPLRDVDELQQLHLRFPLADHDRLLTGTEQPPARFSPFPRCLLSQLMQFAPVLAARLEADVEAHVTRVQVDRPCIR